MTKNRTTGQLLAFEGRQIMQSDLHPTRSETCICSVGIGSRSSQLEQHASLFAAVDDSATLMVVGSVHRAPVGGCGLLRGERLLAYRLMDLAQDGVVWNAFSTFIAPSRGRCLEEGQAFLLRMKMLGCLSSSGTDLRWFKSDLLSTIITAMFPDLCLDSLSRLSLIQRNGKSSRPHPSILATGRLRLWW